MTNPSYAAARCAGRSIRSGALLLALTSVLGACNSLFEVENPNQLKEADLANASAAAAIANGALATVANGFSASLLPQTAISDELKWVGSYDSGRELMFGGATNGRNEFMMGGYPTMAQGRWMADEAIARLEAFDKAGQLANRDDLARSYVYAAIAYTSIADMWEDFTLSDRRTAAPALGSAGMVKMYDTAIGYLDNAITIARARKSTSIEAAAMALRARARHGKAVRSLLAPRKTPTNGLVNDAAAVADARQFFALNPEPDYKYRFKFSATTVTSTLGAWVNERREFRIGDAYVIPDATDKQVGSVRLLDPITGQVDPAISGIINEFKVSRQYGPLTVVSARELHLIIAEAALAGGDVATAVSEMNAVRALDNLPAYNPAVHTTVTPRDLLLHERRANLLLQGRRLLDMYRFGVASPQWQSASDAVRTPGILLPIADVERLSNCYLNGSC